MLFLAYLEQTTTNEVCHYLKRNNQEPTQRSTTYVKLRTCAPPWMHGHRNRSAPEEWRPSERSDVSVTKTQYCNISPSDLKYAVQIVKWNNNVFVSDATRVHLTHCFRIWWFATLPNRLLQVGEIREDCLSYADLARMCWTNTRCPVQATTSFKWMEASGAMNCWSRKIDHCIWFWAVGHRIRFGLGLWLCNRNWFWLWLIEIPNCQNQKS